MQLPIKAHYATLAMFTMAVRYPSGQLLTAKSIADQQTIPSQFLGQILQQLRTAGLIISIRGSAGGFRLAAAPEQITLADIIAAVGSGNSTNSTPMERDPLSQVVNEVWCELDQLQAQFLSNLTLEELTRRLAPDAAMFYI